MLLMLQSCSIFYPTKFKFFDKLGSRDDELEKQGVYIGSLSWQTGDPPPTETRFFLVLYQNGACRDRDIISNLDYENPDVDSIEHELHNLEDLYHKYQSGWGYYQVTDSSYYMKSGNTIFPHQYIYESFGTVLNDSTIHIKRVIKETNGAVRDTLDEVSIYKFVRTSYKPDSTFNFTE
jgi:hypothetical protein